MKEHADAMKDHANAMEKKHTPLETAVAWVIVL